MNFLNHSVPSLLGSLALVIGMTSCDQSPTESPAVAAEAAVAMPEATSNRVAIPPSVRSNLGITFVKAERRKIEDTIRAPGRFEYTPNATREYRTVLSGQVDVLINQFDKIEPGTPLYRLDSPAWRDVKKEIGHALSAVSQLQATIGTFAPLLKAHTRHEESLEESIKVWQARTKKLDALRAAGGGHMSEFTAARSALATAQADLANVQEKTAELHASQAKSKAALQAAESNLEFSLDAAGSLLGLDAASLLLPSTSDPDAPPLWRTIETIEVKAVRPGVVHSIDLANGSWVEANATVMTVVQPEMLRFHASGLQSDLGVLRDGLKAFIVPPTPTESGNAVPLSSTMQGTLRLGLAGDAEERTVDLYVTPDQLTSWARPGVSAQLEIVIEGTAPSELAIPLASVQRDGLKPIIFLRAADNPNEAIRMDADLGLEDGRWIAVLSGLRDGDEVVLDGGFQLMLATSGSIQKGGHFHSDGTFHEGEH
ncbi:MAG: HlyD family efflux transporter periplasmic adaptor subunit [Phycisphaerales bacterium]|nr:HlyD family efflux transporter periplasmic adaptor subunit [Phycisphaerales bacterium]